jgi:hypothetical protein
MSDQSDSVQRVCHALAGSGREAAAGIVHDQLPFRPFQPRVGVRIGFVAR